MVTSGLVGPAWKNREEVKSIKPSGRASMMAGKLSSGTDRDVKPRQSGIMLVVFELFESFGRFHFPIDSENLRIRIARLG
jgi:hypothetical protein